MFFVLNNFAMFLLLGSKHGHQTFIFTILDCHPLGRETCSPCLLNNLFIFSESDDQNNKAMKMDSVEMNL